MLVNGRYPTRELVIGVWGSNIFSKDEMLVKGKDLTLYSGQKEGQRTIPTCQAIARELPITFQDKSYLCKRQVTIRSHIVGGACQRPKPTESSLCPSTKIVSAISKAPMKLSAHSGLHTTKGVAPSYCPIP